MDQHKKILFVANVHQVFLNNQVPYLKWLADNGHEVHVAACGDEQIPYAARQFNFSIQRRPFEWKNIKAYFELKKIISENKYDLIHCHTPMGGVLTQLAACNFRKKNGLKVIYTAHGFHFYKGAPLIYWLLYYPVEKFLSRFTDALITINEEDYKNTVRFGFKCSEIFRIQGIGANSYKFRQLNTEEKKQIRNENGYSDNCFLLVYAAEFNHGKNHRFVIDALPQLIKQIPNLKVIFAGDGELKDEMVTYARQHNVLDNIDFVGFRNDIEKLMGIADVGISSSRREGLPMNVAEEMFCGIPVVVSRIRGHIDLIAHGSNGFLFEEGNREGFILNILNLYWSPELRKQLGGKGKETVQPFGIENVMKDMIEYYKLYL